MLTKEHKSALINLAFEGEQENYNRYWMTGLVKFLGFWACPNTQLRQEMLKFLATTNTVTQRLYLELMWFAR